MKYKPAGQLKKLLNTISLTLSVTLLLILMHEHDGYQSLITLLHNKHCSIWRSGFELGLLKSTKRLLDKRVIYTELPLQERSITNPPHSPAINTTLIVSVTGETWPFCNCPHRNISTQTAALRSHLPKHLPWSLHLREKP